MVSTGPILFKIKCFYSIFVLQRVRLEWPPRPLAKCGHVSLCRAFVYFNKIVANQFVIFWNII